jgi:hypothetical protein
MVSPSVRQRALKVALIVGTTLNFINQGEVLFAMDLVNLNITKLFFTYLVPYSVTTYTVVALKLEFQLGTKAVADVNLECSVCHEEIHLKENEIIPECGICGINTHWHLR